MLVKTKFNCYVYSDAKNSAAGARVSLLLLVVVLATGRVPPRFGDLGIEAFHQKTRLLGSSRSHRLPGDLTDADVASPMLPDYVSIVRSLRDGCCNQCNSASQCRLGGTPGIFTGPDSHRFRLTGQQLPAMFNTVMIHTATTATTRAFI